VKYYSKRRKISKSAKNKLKIGEIVEVYVLNLNQMAFYEIKCFKDFMVKRVNGAKTRFFSPFAKVFILQSINK
jgi:hypothetical protein